MFGWTGDKRYGVAEEFDFTLAAGQAAVDLEMIRFTKDGALPRSPVVHAIEIRKGPSKWNSKYARQDKFRSWKPQLYDGSTWIYAIDVGGGGFKQADGFEWSQDFGYFFPPNIGGTGRIAYTASDPINTIAPFEKWMWRTVKKSPSANDILIDPERILPLTYKLPVPTEGEYWVLLFYCDNDYSKPFSVEFGRCNDVAGTGASYPVDATVGWPGAAANTDRQAHIFGYRVDSRDKMITIDFGLSSATNVPALTGIMIRAYDGKVPKLKKTGISMNFLEL